MRKVIAAMIGAAIAEVIAAEESSGQSNTWTIKNPRDSAYKPVRSHRKSKSAKMRRKRRGW